MCRLDTVRFLPCSASIVSAPSTPSRPTGTVAGAAAALHLTPSGVSQQLAKLEREAGASLTEPAGRGLRLTPAGRVLADHAVEVLARMATARADSTACATRSSAP